MTNEESFEWFKEKARMEPDTLIVANVDLIMKMVTALAAAAMVVEEYSEIADGYDLPFEFEDAIQTLRKDLLWMGLTNI